MRLRGQGGARCFGDFTQQIAGAFGFAKGAFGQRHAEGTFDAMHQFHAAQAVETVIPLE